MAGQVRGGHGHGTEVAQKGQERVLVRHAHADGAASLPQVPPEVGAGTQDECESAGPEGAREGSRIVGNIDAQGVDGVDRGDEDGRRHLTTASLGGQHRVHGIGVGGVASDPVDGVRGNDEDATAVQFADCVR